MAGSVVRYTLEVQDKASAPVEKVADAADHASAALKGATQAATASTRAVQAAASANSSMATSARAVAVQLPDVISQLSAGASPMTVFAQQGLQVAQQLDMIALASKAAQVAASPLGLAIAGIATAAIVAANQISEARTELERYTSAIKDADTATRALSLSQNALKLATGDVAGFVGDLQIQTALLSGEISKGDVAAGQLGGKLADTLRPRLLDAGKAVAQVEAQIQSLSAAIASGSLNVGERLAAEGQLAGLRKSRDELRANLEAVKSLEGGGVAAIEAYANALDKAATSGEKAATTTRKMADDAERMAAVAGAMQALQFGVGRQGALAGVRSQDFGFTGQQAEEMWRKSLRGALESRQVVEGASAMWRSAADAAAAEARTMDVLGGVGTGLNAVVDPLGALGAAGPQGAAVAAILSTLESIGREGTDAIVARLQAQTDAIVQGLGQLPGLIDRLIQELPYSIGQSIASALQSALTPGEGFFNPEKIANRLTFGLFGVAKGVLGMPSVGEGFAVGDSRYVNRTGMALLHEGERVIRSNGGASASTARSAGGMGGWSGPTVIVQTAAVSPDVLGGLADQIGAQLNPDGWGRGTRAVFGG